jgi:hypothetical protein
MPISEVTITGLGPSRSSRRPDETVAMPEQHDAAEIARAPAERADLADCLRRRHQRQQRVAEHRRELVEHRADRDAGERDDPRVDPEPQLATVVASVRCPATGATTAMTMPATAVNTPSSSDSCAGLPNAELDR